MDRKIRVGYISYKSPFDKKAWSGTLYQLYQSIENAGFEVVWIPGKWDIWSKGYVWLLNKGIKIFMHKRGFLWNKTLFVAHSLCRSVNPKQIELVDILFVPGAPHYVYGLKTKKPIIYLNDSTFQQFCDNYMTQCPLLGFNITQGNKIEKKALQNANAIILSSEWARQSVWNDYQVSLEKVKVLEFGANVENKHINSADRKYINCLNLIFIAVEWQRKGGDIAVETTRILHEKGINVKLNIVGIKEPPMYVKELDYVNCLGFLDKNSADQYQKFVRVMDDSHMLLLPTRAECAGIAFCEASAYGLPTFTYDNGGIPNYVLNGISGYRLPMQATAYDFACQIEKSLHENEYETLSKGALNLYNEKLNWSKWSDKFKEIVNDIFSK